MLCLVSQDVHVSVFGSKKSVMFCFVPLLVLWRVAMKVLAVSVFPGVSKLLM
jgi:hypothetical protein